MSRSARIFFVLVIASALCCVPTAASAATVPGWTAVKAWGSLYMSAYGLAFNGPTGVVVGRSGYMARTTNSGGAWTSWLSGSGQPFYGTDANDVCWTGSQFVAVGYNSTIARSADGVTWTTVTRPTGSWSDGPQAIDFYGTQNGWIAGGADAIIWRTTDGGSTWSVVNNQWTLGGMAQNYAMFWDIDFCDALHGWVVGGKQIPSSSSWYPFVMRTSDGGATWTEVPLPAGIGDAPGQLHAVKALGADNVWVGGEPGLLIHWATTATSVTPVWTRSASITSASVYCIYDLDFYVPSLGTPSGWAVGSWGSVYRTTNAGATWTKQAAPNTSGSGYQAPLFQAVRATGASTGYIADGNGYVLRTTNGGAPITVLTKVTLTTPYAPATVRLSQRFSSYGYMKPIHSDLSTKRVRIEMWRRMPGTTTYKLYKYVTTAYGSGGRYAAYLAFPYRGYWRIRAVHPTDGSRATGYSTFRTVLVK